MTSHVISADKCCAAMRWSQRIDGKVVRMPVVISELIGCRYQAPRAHRLTAIELVVSTESPAASLASSPRHQCRSSCLRETAKGGPAYDIASQ